MARWRCNAPNPGSYLQGRGIVFPGQEFTTPDDPDDPFFERARQMWVPLDSGAEKLVKQAKADVEEMNKENARAAAERRRLEDEAASGFRKAEFKTREDQGPGISQSQRFVATMLGRSKSGSSRARTTRPRRSRRCRRSCASTSPSLAVPRRSPSRIPAI
jgi:hypothetical protein